MRNPKWWVVALSAVLLFAILTFANTAFARQNPGGSDFLVHYIGTRALVFDGISPYSDETALKIQQIAYGRPARSGEHELRVAYPLYSIVIFLPFALINDFNLARGLWMTVLEIGLVGFTLLSLRLANWKPGRKMLIFVLLFSVLWYHGMRPLINGNAVILVGVLMAGGLLALRNGEDELAGVLLAFSTIKPQVVLLPLLYLILWALYRKRHKLVGWIVGTVVLLTISGMLLIPDWILQNLREVIRYPLYNPPGTLQASLKVWFPATGERLGNAVSIILGLILLVEWWRNRQGDSRANLWVFSLTLVISQWIGIQTDPGNFVILVPALFTAVAIWEERWGSLGRIISVILLVGLLVGIWAIFLATVAYDYQPIQSPVMFLPLPGILLMLLYWVRWWAVRPVNLWYDLLRQKDNP